MLKRVYDLKSQTEVFLESDGNIFSSALQSRLDMQICVDVTSHKNGDNLQGANRLMNEMHYK
jgi:hypothetical protein